jgi:hypothetical protein
VFTGKDGNPLNAVKLPTESLMNNDGVLRGNMVVKWPLAPKLVQRRLACCLVESCGWR